MKANENFSVEQRFMNLQQTAAYLGIGLTNIRKFVKDHALGVRFGQRIRVDKIKLDELIESLYQEQNKTMDDTQK